ncbi:hypothetical protein [Mycetocola zhujimingii]|uniref:Polyketide cyclase / dehydrase and lipid transport n=1 Tax=Mycetocola zhujimingii TaxID=2079792 RepID=A0A2U1TER1_9MICO|nr:hypothetical protein [Mycetocola zhujimingii]PWC07364.1 hypothetical protein DF223_07015 [Mycetocola zhujimingii]
MTESAPLERPVRSTPLRAYAGEIHADPDAVFAALERRLREGSTESTLAVDRAGRFVAVQGGWWYRAEYRVMASDDGARIEHEVLNVAPRLHWAGPLAGRRVLADSPAAFGALLTGLAAELER